MIDNSEMERILNKLEAIEDDNLAVKFLAEFNSASKELGKLLLNLDQSLSHEDWKKRCDEARVRLEKIVRTIDDY